MASGGHRGGLSIKVTETSLFTGIKTLPGAVNRAAAFAMMKNVGPVENWMKQNALWTDRTTNARNGLSARYVGSSGGNHTMVLFHSVDYGIWLEVANEGRFAIIEKAIEEGGKMVMDDLVNILDRIKSL